MRVLMGVPVLFLALGCAETCKHVNCSGHGAHSPYYAVSGSSPSAEHTVVYRSAEEAAAAHGVKVGMYAPKPAATTQARYALEVDWAHIPVPVPRVVALPEEPNKLAAYRHPPVLVVPSPSVSHGAVVPAATPTGATAPTSQGPVIIPAGTAPAQPATSTQPTAPAQPPVPVTTATPAETNPGQYLPAAPMSPRRVSQQDVEEMRKQLEVMEKQLREQAAPEGEQPKP